MCFDGIVASVEAQRNDALQSVSQGVNGSEYCGHSTGDAWMVSIGSTRHCFTRFADSHQQCVQLTSLVHYIAMCNETLGTLHQ